jgi:exonuclease SbcD
MNIGVCGDVHIGGSYVMGKTDPTTQLNSRLLDFTNTFNSIVDNFVAKGVKLMVLTGDVFEHRTPTPSQLNAFSKSIQRAVKLGLELVIVVGNHDQQRNIDTTTVDVFSHLELPNVSVYQNMGIKTIKDGDKEHHLILMPYRDRRMLNAETNSDAILLLKNQLKEVIKDKNGTKILVGHFMLEKTQEDENPDSFSINELVLPFDTFEGFDAVLMGHIHRHEVVSKNPLIIYTGSMDKVSFSEKEHQKVSIIFNTDDINKYEIINTSTRNVFELNFDYSNTEKLYKDTINDKINADVDEFDKKQSIKDAIIKLIVRVKDADLYHINHQKIRENLLNKKINNLLPLQITSAGLRQLRNSNIKEDTNTKKAITSFISSLSEPEQIKKRLQKFAENIIDECE